MLPKIFNPKTLISLLIAFAAFLFFACTSQQNKSNPEPTSPTSIHRITRKPVKICVLQDKSGSTKWNRVPQITPRDMDSLLEIVMHNGGEIGFGLVNDDSNRPLIRIIVEEPPAKPAPPKPPKKGNIFMRRQKAARQQLKYNTQLEKYKKDMEVWHEETDKLVSKFKSMIQPILEIKPNYRRTDIAGALLRAKLFLDEPECGWSQPLSRYILMVSDGVDTVGKAFKPLQNPAKLILVNSSAEVGALKPLSPLCFEDLSAAIRWIKEEAR